MHADERFPGGCRVLPASAATPGAIAIFQLVGDVEPVLASLTGRSDWPIGAARLVHFADIDEGIAVRLGRDTAQVMPHGGPRIGQRLLAWFGEHGVVQVSPRELDPLAVYPEAADVYEALALAAVARAASPLAVDLLLDQPRRWRGAPAPLPGDLARSRRLDRLIDPPVVVVAGAPNVGKSTLSNALLGRSMSIALDLPGTTRDYTTGRIDLAGLVADWHDTPGLRDTADPIEVRAIEIARGLLERADLIVAMRDAGTGWPLLPRRADLHVVNKLDLSRPRAGPGDEEAGALGISAVTGEGLAELVAAVRDRLVPPEDLEHPGPWLFDPRLLGPGREDSRGLHRPLRKELPSPVPQDQNRSDQGQPPRESSHEDPQRPRHAVGQEAEAAEP